MARGKHTLPVIAEVLKEAGEPLRVAQILDRAGSRITSRSQQPHNVLARDISLDIRDNPSTQFIRVEPGLYGLKPG